ncbi:phage tail domain-containing protein [Microbacterium sp.]|uniref:phage tail domain-containing protein n=1 Tax=Microbacterium sp. TaxID=51671 RepID=UPI003A95DF53
MSFTFGGFDSDSLGLVATLAGLPSFGGLQLETLEAPGTDGQLLAATTLSKAQFTFDVIIRGETPEDAHAKRDALALALDPVRGEQQLTFDAAPGWVWAAILSGTIDWARLTWEPGLGFQLRGDVTFDALEAYGRPVTDDTWEWATPGTRTITRQQGNARSFPTVEILGTLTAAQTVTVTIGAVAVTVTGPLSAAQTLRLDWETFDFARWAGAVKVASVVRGMSNLDRPELWPGEAAQVKVATTGTVTSVVLRANSRRQ